MSRKTKSELSFLLKITLLFVILFVSKFNRTDLNTVSDKSAMSVVNSDSPRSIHLILAK